MAVESRLLREARATAARRRAEQDAAELVEWLLLALDLPEVQAKLRALCTPPAPAPPTVGGRGAPRRRGH